MAHIAELTLDVAIGLERPPQLQQQCVCPTDPTLPQCNLQLEVDLTLQEGTSKLPHTLGRQPIRQRRMWTHACMQTPGDQLSVAINRTAATSHRNSCTTHNPQHPQALAASLLVMAVEASNCIHAVLSRSQVLPGPGQLRPASHTATLYSHTESVRLTNQASHTATLSTH